MVPGEKRSPGDRAIAGAAAGPGAVQAGALELMRFGPVGLAPALPALAAGLNAQAVRYAATARAAARPDRAAVRGAAFEHRTALASSCWRGRSPTSSSGTAWPASRCSPSTPPATSSTADAVARRASRPRLDRLPAAGRRRAVALPEFSYRRVLAEPHPRTTRHWESRRERRDHRRRRHRHRLRRRDPGLLPRRRRRRGGHARARPASWRPRSSRRPASSAPTPAIVDLIHGDGLQVVAGNCVGGRASSTSRRPCARRRSSSSARGSVGSRRLWPADLTRSELDPWYDRVEETLPVAQQTWDDVPYAGGVWAAACANAGHTCNPVPVAVDLPTCTNCNWMLQRLPLRREALDAAQLPAGRAGPRRARSARCTRCSRSVRRSPRATATGSTTPSSTPATTASRPGPARSRRRS